MSGGGTRTDALVPAGAAGPNPWLIAVVVAVATFMEVLDTTIANVALPYIAGGMEVQRGRSLLGGDNLPGLQCDHSDRQQLSRPAARPQALLPDVPGAVHRELGAVRICLEPELAAAVPHPAGPRWRRHGAGLAIDPGELFPPAKRGQAFALFGVAVVVAPVVGPTLGGWLSDNVSWHWCFLINGPVGLLAMVAIAIVLREFSGGGAPKGSI